MYCKLSIQTVKHQQPEYRAEFRKRLWPLMLGIKLDE